MWTELILIFICIILNGFFAGSEIAVVSVRKTRVTELEKQGSGRAQLLHRLKSDPDRFLATVQIGVTIVGVMASAIGGAAAIQTLVPLIEKIPVGFVSASSEAIAIGFVVILVSYLMLIMGELVPKSIAIKNPERVALLVARPIFTFSRILSLFVSVLTASTKFFLRILGIQPHAPVSFVTEEEIKLFVSEGRDRGFFEPDEEQLIHSVFEFTDLSVQEIMVPISRVTAFSIETPADEVLTKIIEEQFSRYPVYHRERTNIKGMLYVKDLLKRLVMKEPVDLKKLLRAPLFIPESMKISSLLREMQRTGVHIAAVVDEYGTVSGIATIEDILEEIVGEIRDEFDIEQPVITMKDGSFLIDASISIRDLRDDHGISLPESPDYDSLGGFVIARLQKIPAAGEEFEVNGWKFRVVNLVGRRISRVVLQRSSPEEPSPDAASPGREQAK